MDKIAMLGLLLAYRLIGIAGTVLMTSELRAKIDSLRIDLLERQAKNLKDAAH